VWEFIFPVFPGIILFVGLLNVTFREVILVQFPLTIVAIIVGFIWEYKNLRKNGSSINKKDMFLNLKQLFLGIWSILMVIILVTVLKIDLLISLTLVIFSLFLTNFNKLKLPVVKKIVKNDIDLSVVILIAGIMIFQRMLQVSGGMEIIPEAFAKLGVHSYIILFSIPFCIAMVTGISSAAIGIGIPILLPIIIPGEVNFYYAMFAYTGAFAGVMLSPVHLCLVVTRNYFKSDLNEIYKMLIFPLSTVVLSALIMLLLKG
ncbi:MAG: DUF401 family protein, partial [Candidatus Caldatribacteriota bacterium]|nr:DUF401 family protein [Candidatus Caldatribacteriota bacterium]